MASYDDTATVSGSVVGFSNGADSVPLKNWLVTLPASLDGYSEVNAKQAKKNLIKPDKYQTAGNNLALGQNDGTSFGTFLKAGTYAISYETTGDSCYIYRREENDTSNTNMGKRLSTTFTLESDGNFRFWLYGDGAVSANISNVQIEVGSTATSYEAYEAPTTYTASLGRTIYGGQADIVTGEGEAQFAYHKLTSADTMYLYNSANGFLVSTSTFAEGEMVALSNSGGLCNAFDTVTTSTNTGVRFGMSNNSNIYFVQVQSIMGNTLQDIKDYIDSHDIYVVYRLATPSPFTFTPVTIETSKGSNTFWSDQGNTELTYYKDGYGFTSVTIHKETPDGEPVEQTAKLHKIVYGGLVDVISGKAEPKNLFNEDWEIGGINDTTGLPNSETNKIRSKTFSSIKGGATCYVGVPKNIRVLFYASDESFISETTNIKNSTFTTPVNCSLFKIRGTVDYGTTYSDDIIICYGSSASEYVPYFEPFTFPPISMETDEGENTLYADEGDSAIVYRKES